MEKVKLKLRDENGKIYFGWWILVMSALLGTFAYNGIVSTTGVFLLPVTTALGISAGAFSLYISILSVTNIIVLFIISKFMVEKYIKKIMLVAAALGVISFIGFSFSTQIWQFYLWSVPMGFCFSACTMTPCTILVNNWFGPMVRGKAMSFYMCGMSLIGVPLINILNYVVMTGGYKGGYIFSAAGILICIPIILKCAVWSPEKKGIKRMGDVDAETEAMNTMNPDDIPGIPFKEGIKKPLTWVALISCTLLVIVSSGALQHAIPTMIMAGWTSAAATAISSIISILLIFSGLVIGIATDKMGLFATSVITVLMFALATFCYAFIGEASWLLYPMIAGYIFGVPAVNILSPLMMGHMFGDKEVGRFIAYVNIFISLGGIFGGLVISMLFDMTGGYKLPWLVCTAILVVCCILRALCTRKSVKFVPEKN